MIRDLEPRDVPAVAELLGDTMRERPVPTPAGLAHWFDSHPPRAALGVWVAEQAGELVGVAMARITWTVSPGDVAFAWVGVRGPARGRGLGGALWAAAERHVASLPVRKLETFTFEGSPFVRFAEARGFRPTRLEYVQVLELAGADVSQLPALLAAQGEDVRVVPLRALGERVADLHELYTAAEADIPADDPEDDLRVEEFESHVLADPMLDHDLSAVVLAGGRPVALAFVSSNHEVGEAANAMTGTHPDFRGRGLARLAKLSAIAAAREAGLRAVWTGNDAENAPMLALNRSLGYRVVYGQRSFAREPAV